MPEIPDLTVYLDFLQSHIVGETLEHVRLASPFVLRTADPPLKAAEGKRVLGLRRLGDQETARSDTAERSGLPSTGDWVSSGDVGEIRRLRVALEWRRRGVATALTRQLIAASVDSLRLRGLVLNTYGSRHDDPPPTTARARAS